MTDDELHRCRVCGLWTEELPYGADNKSWKWASCPCCGAEHGYQDITFEGARQHREKWLASGAAWSSPKERPSVWDSVEQMNHIPLAYR